MRGPRSAIRRSAASRLFGGGPNSGLSRLAPRPIRIMVRRSRRSRGPGSRGLTLRRIHPLINAIEAFHKTHFIRSVLRMFYPQEKIAIFIDGANLYAAARGLGFDIDY